MQEFHSDNATFAYTTAGKDFTLNAMQKKNGTDGDNKRKPLILWAHGWGGSHESLSPLIEPFGQIANHIAIDFPGFGLSPEPPEIWGTEDYADMVAKWIKSNNLPPVIWIGHSFGCRVGTQMAANHPECIKAMVYIAGAGLRKKMPIQKRLYYYFRIKLFKALRHLLPEGALKKRIMKAFGSRDYNKSSGKMRKIFVKVVNEDLTDIAKGISCPVALIYGTSDTETPPDMGKRYSQLIKNSKLFLLDNQDHYTVLQNGRHQVIKIISDFIKSL